MPPVFVVKMPLAQSNLVPQGVIWGDVDPGICCKMSLRWHENRALKDSFWSYWNAGCLSCGRGKSGGREFMEGEYRVGFHSWQK